MPNIILLDNFDSFSYNLVDQFRTLGYPVTVYRNHLSADSFEQAVYQQDNPIVILSPGPGSPKDAGCMPEVILRLKGKVPMIGICLGHQGIIEAYGGTVARAEEIVHGKSSMMTHHHHPIFDQLSTPISIARYHSLVATHVPETLTTIATVDHLTMAVISEKDKVCGFQFHPESILTTQGEKLLTNTINWIVNDRSPEVAHH